MSDDMERMANEVMWEKELADMPEDLPNNVLPFGQPGDDEVNDLKRRGNAMALKTTVEVERKDDAIHLIVGVGKSSTTYKLSAGLAKELGEDLFKQGCNLETSQRNKSA